MGKIIYILSTILLLLSCGTQNSTKQNYILNEETKLIISYSQTSTTESYPAYTIELFSNRQMYLTASNNLDKYGKYMRVLSEKEFNQIVKTFNKANIHSFNDEYTSDNKNSPTQFIYFSSNEKEKRIKYHSNSPQEIVDLELLIRSFLDRVGWEKMSW